MSTTTVTKDQMDLERINFLSNERLEQRLKRTTVPGDQPQSSGGVKA